MPITAFAQWQRSSIVKLSYRGIIALSALVFFSSIVAPSAMAATMSESLPTSKARAQADAKVLLGVDSSPTVKLVRSDGSFRVSNTSSTVAVEQDLRHELAFQGYSQDKVDAAVTALKKMAQYSNNNAPSVPVNAQGAIGLGESVTLSLPSASASTAQSVNDTTVVYHNTQVASDTLVKAVDSQTVETQHIIRSKAAPEQFVYKLNNLPAGAQLRQVNAQTVAAYLPQQTIGKNTSPETTLGTFKAPWARDAMGRSVPLSLTIGTDNILVLNVQHHSANYLYPIVADPFAWWGWHGFMWWGDNYTINHFSQVPQGAAVIAAVLGWEVAGAAAASIAVVAAWCEGPHGATFYFHWVPFPPYVNFVWCSGW